MLTVGNHHLLSDAVSLNKSKTAYCVNCGTKLPFTLIREGEEQVE